MKTYLNLLNPLLWFKWHAQILYYLYFILVFLGTCLCYILINLETPVLQQNNYYFIFLYLHVPSSWFALQLYIISSLLVLLDLYFEQQIIFKLALKAITKIGFICTILSLMSGMLWGYPIWGVFWVWDPRLTSMFMLFLLYVLYFLLLQTKITFIPNIILLTGIINIPIIKYSVEWWNSLHQVSSLTKTYLAINYSEYIPLVIALLFFSVICGIFYILYFQIALLDYKEQLK